MDDADDSLFEGMILFDPSSSSSQFPPLDNTNTSDDPVQLPNHHEISHQSVQSTTSFEPLDENLFSDLTLIQPQPENDDVSNSLDPPLSPSSSSTSSRSTNYDFATTTSFSSVPQTSTTSTRSFTTQVSSRKKKRAGLRIGYGRTYSQSLDSSVDVDNSQPVSATEEKIEAGEEKKENQIVSDAEIRSETPAAEAVATELEDVEKVEDLEEERIERNEAVVMESVKSTLEHKPEQEVTQGSIELRYEAVRKQIGEKLERAQREMLSVSVKRKEVIRKRRKVVEELNVASVRYKEMERELEEAVESEDFETAERVSDGLALAEKEKEVLSVALREAEAECDAVDDEMKEALEMQIVAEEECAGLLQSFAVGNSYKSDTTGT